MSAGAPSYKIEDFVLNLTNFQCMIYRQLSEASDRQSRAIESIANCVKNFVDIMTIQKTEPLNSQSHSSLPMESSPTTEAETMEVPEAEVKEDEIDHSSGK